MHYTSCRREYARCLSPKHDERLSRESIACASVLGNHCRESFPLLPSVIFLAAAYWDHKKDRLLY